MNKDNLYHYKAMVISVYDGDTIRVDIDLGCGIWLKNQSIRLFGINTPEVRGEERAKGLESRDVLRGFILNKEIVLQTIKDKTGKYGRLLGIVWINNINVNEWLVIDGYAEKRDY